MKHFSSKRVRSRRNAHACANSGSHRRAGFLHLMTAFLLVVIFVSVAVVFNVGVATSRKVRAQNAADAAAYSGAVQISRTVNVTTGTNINIVRTASAESLAWAVWPTVYEVERNWARAIDTAGPFGGAVAAYIAAHEVPVLAAFIAQAGPTGAQELTRATLVRRIERMHRWQREVAQSTPRNIEHQRALLEEYYNTKIALVQLGSPVGQVFAPVREPRGASERLGVITVLLQKRISEDRAGWNDKLRRIVLGRGRQAWSRQTSRMGMVVALRIQGRFMLLDTHDGLVERKPTRLQRNDRFALTACARMERHARLLPGVFASTMHAGSDALAFAQAETYHMADHGQNPRPAWRLWSPAGWHWQPRLTWGRALPEVLQGDSQVNRWFRHAGVLHYDNLDDIILH